MNKVQEVLTQLAKTKLESAVVEEIISNTDGFTDEETTQYMEDVLAHGCISGCVSGLIYYNDTATFFDTHYEAIEDLRVDYEDETNDSVLARIGTDDLKNSLAWWSFEWVTYNLFNQLEDFMPLEEEEEEEEAL